MIVFAKGDAYRLLSRYDEALPQFHKAALIYRGRHDQKGEADVLTRIADTLMWVSDHKGAIRYYQEALTLYKSVGTRTKQVEALAALGEVGWFSGLISERDALTNFKEAEGLEIYAVRALNNLVDRLGKSAADLPSSKDTTQQKLELQIELGKIANDDRAAIGILYQKWGRVLLQYARELEHATAGLYLASLCHGSLSDRDSQINLAKDWYFLGEADRRRGNLSRALLYFQAAEQLTQILGTNEIHWIHAGLARTYADMGDLGKALRAYETGLEGLERIQHGQEVEEIKMGAFGGAMYAYRWLPHLLVELHRKQGREELLQKAFHTNERMKARVFLEMMTKSRMMRVEGEQIASRSRQKVETLPVVTVQEVQSVLGEESALLEYSVTAEGMVLWAVTSEQIQGYSLPNENTQSNLDQYLKTLRAPLIGRDETAHHLTLGKELYRSLIKPAETLLREKKHLIIAPDGPLHYLPFEALIIPDTNDNSVVITKLTDARYLIEQFQVTYMPSASVMVAQHKAKNAPAQSAHLPLLAFGDPIYPETKPSKGPDVESITVSQLVLRGFTLGRLEYSGEEVRRIAGIWDVALDSPHVNLRDRASVERLRELDVSQYRLLHFATHAVLQDEFGQATQPVLVLSQRGSEPDLLRFADILELKLKAALVVLSACNTGLGKLREGEGIVGLTRAFLYAGADAVAVSLWKVEDQTTSLLMERFHQRLKQGLGKAEALRQAKLELMRETIELKALGMRQSLASPFYWSAFILVGNWE